MHIPSASRRTTLTRRLCFFAALGLALLGHVSSGRGQAPAPKSNSATPERSIAVTVLDAATDRPIPGATVARPDFSGWPRPEGPREAPALTDAGGVATVRIPPLTKSMTAYFLSVQHSNYAGRVIRWQIREQS